MCLLSESVKVQLLSSEFKGSEVQKQARLTGVRVNPGTDTGGTVCTVLCVRTLRLRSALTGLRPEGSPLY